MRRQRIRELMSEGAILEVQDGNHGEKHPTSADYVEEGIPFLMARDFRDGQLDLSGACKITRQLGDTLRVGFARSGDVLLTHKGSVGLVALVPDVPDYVMLTPQVTYYRTNAAKLHNRYLRYAFQAPTFRSQLDSVSAQSTRPYIGITAQKELFVDVPSVPVQHHIAGILSAYDDLMENSQRRIKILESMTRALYREWFVHFRFPGYESVPLVPSPLGEIPKGWAVARIDEALSFESGRTLKKTERENGDTPVYGANGIIGGTANSPMANQCIIMGKIGSCGALHRSHLPCWVTNNAFLVKPAAIQFWELAWQTLLGIDFRQYVGGAANPYMPINVFGQHEVLIAPGDVQTDFQERAAPLRRLVGTLSERADNLRRTRDLLLPRLLSGQIDLKAIAS